MDIGGAVKSAYRRMLIKGAGYDPDDPEHEAKMAKDLSDLERSNDPKGKAYGMGGKTFGKILEENSRMDSLRKLLKKDDS